MREETADRGRKRTIRLLFLAGTGLLLFFTFFSHTLLSFTLPKVTAEEAASGSLAFALEGSGTVQPVTVASLANPAGWKVRDILVREGDRVKKGQTLITYDASAAEQELADETALLAKMKLELESAQDRYIQLARDGDPFQIRGAKRDIDAQKLDLATQERKLGGLRKKLDDERKLTAPYDGTITALHAVEGSAPGGEPDAVMAGSGQGFRFELAVDAALASDLGVALGQRIDVAVAASGRPPRTVKGTVAELADTGPRADVSSGEAAAAIPQKRLRIQLADPGLKGGEQAHLRLEKRSSEEGWIVSGGAVHRDRDGDYVFRIEERRGALGNVYIARKVPLKESRSNGTETMIRSDTIYEHDLIIQASSEPLQDGDRVRLQ
ncbi:Multidrug efflux pump subunit AcrA (membrane-fusion protein) [Paenibacillus sp. UNC496MF]|uniref:efflux RND transporter periplasmic adaptor subunit n=1 Tax=Paenibacillus sp. UNC496MF TaxID=1502753 RepID=UPI0008E7393D|nr:biotin/lipoyl-binding protein [Paenibacillus sp. UNC496MF]SFI40884.1 Multidrug efflux pump subunit AcrA (membrane-fusion protein) [Paenibacillus sp. UNC496MF]